ncbi:uncharacterized protein LOC126787224 [Argentina anserina]|uniref:uncharacterized protein LOC126787224 n=1 Tax=Argentina anserina TaxID=57926 RepID=UPI00217661DD|nr:uncharacterized protein LOC126787224 [Potentilla anserina]
MAINRKQRKRKKQSKQPQVKGIARLKIDAPNLQSLRIQGKFEDVELMNTLILFMFQLNENGLMVGGTDCSEAQLNPQEIEEATSWEFLKLQRVKVTGLCGARVELEFIRNLLLSSPGLQEFHISFQENKNNNRIRKSMWRLGDATMGNGNPEFTQLRRMNISGFSCAETEIGFIKYLLTSSPMLHQITLQPASADVAWEVTKLLIEFKSSNSVQADFKLLDPSYPSDDYHPQAGRLYSGFSPSDDSDYFSDY